MWTRLWNNDKTLSALDELRRQMELAIGSTYGPRPIGESHLSASWPAINLYDAGDELVLEAWMPGMGPDDIEMTATAESLTLTGERKAEAPEGYVVHRRERGNVKFARSVGLPARIDANAVSASLEQGVLTVRMTKAAEAKPRQITVKARG